MIDYRLECGDCTQLLRSMAPRSVDLVIGSPPYPEKGSRYGGKEKWPTAEWIDWMLDVSKLAVRACKGYVVWVVNGAVRQGKYLPACEGLIWKAHEAGIIVERPCIWHKNAPPNRRDWFGNDWEYVVVFKGKAKGNYFDWGLSRRQRSWPCAVPPCIRSTTCEALSIPRLPSHLRTSLGTTRRARSSRL